MAKLSRVALYVVLVLAGAVGTRVALPGNEAKADSAPRVADPARIATCDVYAVMQALVESDRYKPKRVAGQEKARAELKEIAGQIGALEQQLKTMDPKDEKTLAIFREFNSKKDQFTERQKELDEFLGDQFVEAYAEVRKAADAVGEREGYTHVLVTRGREEKVSNSMDQATQQMLSRPVLRAPAADDITERVLSELKL
jgi:hypothetical protein